MVVCLIYVVIVVMHLYFVIDNCDEVVFWYGCLFE